MPYRRLTQLRFLLLVLILSVSLAACGGSTTPSSTTTPTTEPTTVASNASPTSVANTSVNETVVNTEESFPTPDVAKKMAEMDPTAVVVEGQHPIPTSGADTDGNGTYSKDEFLQALDAAYPYYNWPEAYHPSLDYIVGRLSLDQLPDEVGFEIPSEISVLGLFHQCAWEKSWLDAFAAGDQATMDQSMEQLRTVSLTNPMFAGIIFHAEQIYNQAELGDPAALIQTVDANCDWLKTFRSPVSETQDNPRSTAIRNQETSHYNGKRYQS